VGRSAGNDRHWARLHSYQQLRGTVGQNDSAGRVVLAHVPCRTGQEFASRVPLAAQLGYALYFVARSVVTDSRGTESNV